MMSDQTKRFLKYLLFKEFYEKYDFYITDLEFGKKYPEYADEEFSNNHKMECDEVVTALSDLLNISFEEAENKLIGCYKKKKSKTVF